MFYKGGLQGLWEPCGQFLTFDSEIPKEAVFSAWRIDIVKMSPGPSTRQEHRLLGKGETVPNG